jgi:hypothetical protein
MFVRETDNLFDTFIVVSRCPDRGKLLRYRLTGTIKHREHWTSALDKVKSLNFLNKESEPMRPPPSQTV